MLGAWIVISEPNFSFVNLFKDSQYDFYIANTVVLLVLWSICNKFGPRGDSL